MAFKIQDFKCNKCAEVTEVLLDSREKDQVVECAFCHSTEMNSIISPGVANKQHFSWAKWRAGV